MTRRFHAWALVLALVLAGSAPSAAHTLSASHIDVTPSGEGIEVELDVPLRDLALAIPLDADGDDRITWGELKGVEAQVGQLAERALLVSAATGPCPLRITGLGTREREGVPQASLRLSGRCEMGSGLVVRYDLMRDVVPGHAAVVTLREGTNVRVRIARDAGEARFDAGDQGAGRTFSLFLREGVHHILIGYDHLAFLLSLLLPAAVVWRAGRWQPVERASTALRYTLGIVTAFTVAHSVTLSLAVLGIVSPDARMVEIAIASSVLLAAINNIRPLITRRLWVAGFLFGLIHGFGFAGVLAEYELGRGSTALALLGFNLGVELGQLAVVALAIPLIWLLSRRAFYVRFVMPLLSLAIVGWSLVWIWERAVGG